MATVRVKSENSLTETNIEIEITNDPFEKRFAEELLTGEFIRLEAAITTNEFNIFDVGDLKKRISSFVYRVMGLCAGFIISSVLGINVGMSVITSLNVSVLYAWVIGAGLFLILVAICLVAWVKQKKQ